MKRVLLIGAVVLMTAGCGSLREVRTPGTLSEQNQAASARVGMESVCGPAGVRQLPGTDGTNGGDWVCGSR